MKENNLHINQLLERCKKGDNTAQMQIYKDYYRAMYNTSLRILKDEFEAEDIMQEAFLTAFTKLDTFIGEVTFGAWLKRIVINNSLDWLKKRKLEIVSLNDEVYERVEENEDWSIAHSLQADFIVNAIKSLKEKYRVVLSLYLLEGYDHQEIAQVLGITEVASRTHLMRGKKQLQELLKEQNYVEGY